MRDNHTTGPAATILAGVAGALLALLLVGGSCGGGSAMSDHMETELVCRMFKCDEKGHLLIEPKK